MSAPATVYRLTPVEVTRDDTLAAGRYVVADEQGVVLALDIPERLHPGDIAACVQAAGAGGAGSGWFRVPVREDSV